MRWKFKKKVYFYWNLLTNKYTQKQFDKNIKAWRWERFTIIDLHDSSFNNLIPGIIIKAIRTYFVIDHELTCNILSPPRLTSPL